MKSLTKSVYEELNQEIASKIDTILSENNSDSTKLVGILLEVQEVVPKKYIPSDVAAYVAEKLNLPLISVYDVVTFYESLSDTPRGENIINLCNSIVCKANNNKALQASLEKVLGIKVGEATANNKFYLQLSACFGACDVAPAIRINDEVYGNLTEDKLKEVIESYK